MCVVGEEGGEWCGGGEGGECVWWGRRMESVVGEEGGECVWWGRRVESVCGDEGYSAVNMFIPGLGSWWNLLACCY